MIFKEVLKKFIIGTGLLKLSSRYRKPSITILRYHSVQDKPANHESTVGASIIHSTEQFRGQMQLVSRNYNPISMDDVSAYLKDGSVLPPYPVVITFDDGYKDNIDIAAPILEEFNIPATFYIITDAVAGENNATAWFMRIRKAFDLTKKTLWRDDDGKTYALSDGEGRLNARRVAMSYCGTAIGENQLDRVVRIENELDVPGFEEGIAMMLSWDEIRELRGSGHIIGSHTVSHPNLAYVTEDEAEFELEQSKLKLEAELGEVIEHFAYPNPILNPNWCESTYDLCKAIGYKTAVTCDNGCVMFDDEPLTLKRMYTPLSAEDLRWYVENTMNGRKV